MSTVVHCETDGQETPLSTILLLGSSVTRRGCSGDSGLKVISRRASTAVHWTEDGQETASTASPGSIETGTGCWREPGANVTVWPAESTAVHWETEGQETPVVRGIPPRLRRIGPCHDRAVRAGPPASR